MHAHEQRRRIIFSRRLVFIKTVAATIVAALLTASGGIGFAFAGASAGSAKVTLEVQSSLGVSLDGVPSSRNKVITIGDPA